eukprot:748218-Hanusia_phi.AAC.2
MSPEEPEGGIGTNTIMPSMAAYPTSTSLAFANLQFLSNTDIIPCWTLMPPRASTWRHRREALAEPRRSKAIKGKHGCEW